MSKNNYLIFDKDEKNSSTKNTSAFPEEILNNQPKATLFQTLLNVPNYLKLTGEIELSDYPPKAGEAPPSKLKNQITHEKGFLNENYQKFFDRDSMFSHQAQSQIINKNIPLVMLLKFVLQDVWKRPKEFKIGILTIFMVVGFLTVLNAGNELTPIIFIKLAENNIGDADFMVIPNGLNGSALKFVEKAKVEKTCDEMSEFFGCSGR